MIPCVTILSLRRSCLRIAGATLDRKNGCQRQPSAVSSSRRCRCASTSHEKTAAKPNRKHRAKPLAVAEKRPLAEAVVAIGARVIAVYPSWPARDRCSLGVRHHPQVLRDLFFCDKFLKFSLTEWAGQGMPFQFVVRAIENPSQFKSLGGSNDHEYFLCFVQDVLQCAAHRWRGVRVAAWSKSLLAWSEL